MDDMQRYREISDNADPEDPATALRLSVIVACDEALVEALKLERQGKPGKVRALGFTATADLLDDMERRRVRAYQRLFDEAEVATDEHDKALLQEAALIAEDPDAYCNAYPVGLARREPPADQTTTAPR